jgi:hypothetical protein
MTAAHIRVDARSAHRGSSCSAEALENEQSIVAEDFLDTRTDALADGGAVGSAVGRQSEMLEYGTVRGCGDEMDESLVKARYAVGQEWDDASRSRGLDALLLRASARAVWLLEAAPRCLKR